uniref:Nop domain-containing protein n=1 Tax=Vespula pensylvanica TaxID=30213 RepID=A0A834NFZ8_VESPE|nr:hypothetical protein H0235_014250 [Vespula pensylvanica]
MVAKIIDVPGGLAKMFKMPACNILLLGSQRRECFLYLYDSTKAACHESIEGHIGQLLHDEIEKKLDELQELPLVKLQQWGETISVVKRVSGMDTSIAFTPLQDLRIVNSQSAEKKVNEANAEYS